MVTSGLTHYRIKTTNRPGMLFQPPTEMPRNVDEALFKRIDERYSNWVKGYKKARAADARRARLFIRGIRLMYFTRNYFVDGGLPIILGIIALLAIFGVINLHWMQSLFPRFKLLSIPDDTTWY
jgi:hypothetical protein